MTEPRLYFVFNYYLVTVAVSFNMRPLFSVANPKGTLILVCGLLGKSWEANRPVHPVIEKSV